MYQQLRQSAQPIREATSRRMLQSMPSLISTGDYHDLAKDCLEFVSSDTTGTDIDIDFNNEDGVCISSLSTFAGCTDITADVNQAGGVFIQKESLTFSYLIWIKTDADIDDAIEDLETSILKTLATAGGLSCDGTSNGGLMGISSDPVDTLDSSYGACLSDPPLGIEAKRSRCLPVIGEMTLFLAPSTNSDNVASVKKNLLGQMLLGLQEGTIGATSKIILSMSLVNRTKGELASYEVLDETVLVEEISKETEHISTDLNSTSSDLERTNVGSPLISSQNFSKSAVGASKSAVGTIVAGSLATLLGVVLLSLFVVRRRNKEKKHRQKQNDQHPVEISDWEVDAVPENYTINRALGVVYQKEISQEAPPSPDRTASTTSSSWR